MSGAILLDIIRKLETRVRLDDDDRAAVMALPFHARTLPPNSYLVREGEHLRFNCIFLAAGIAFRQKLSAEGARQIVSVNFPGDFLDLQHLFLEVADHNVQALTRLDFVEISREPLQELILSRPAIGRAMWVDGLIEASIYREWVLNVGRRQARARIAHILCEFSLRMRAAGIGSEQGYQLPMTQEQLGDAVGLTAVHVNRTLKALAAEGLIRFDRRHLTIVDWNRICDAGDFNPLYLHLDQRRPPIVV